MNVILSGLKVESASTPKLELSIIYTCFKLVIASGQLIWHNRKQAVSELVFMNSGYYLLESLWFSVSNKLNIVLHKYIRVIIRHLVFFDKGVARVGFWGFKYEKNVNLKIFFEW